MTTRHWLREKTLNIYRRFFNLDVLILVCFSVPILLLCIFVPSTFQVTWKGRAPYIIFIWLILLEIYMSRHKFPEFNLIAELKQPNVRVLLGSIALLVPTVFTVWQYVSGGRDLIVLLGQLLGAPFPEPEWDWPLAFEAMLFTFFFILSVWLLQNLDGLRRFKISLFFLGSVATFFMVDAFFHGGTIWFLQFFVPPIVSIAAFFFNGLGYTTITTAYADGYLLAIRKAGGYPMNLLIYWPCAGVHGLIIYTIVIILFFKNAEISFKRKIIYFVVGAIGTFMTNILRIVSIGIIGVNTGPEASRLFHEYYGELFFIVWIVVYLIAVFLYESRYKAKKRSVME